MKKWLLALTGCLLLPVFMLAQAPNPRGRTPNGSVYDYAALGDTLYSVGFFTRVGYRTGGAGWLADTVPQLQFPITSGEVWAIEPDGVGGWYIGGLFSMVDTLPRTNLAHIFSNGVVSPVFNPAPNGEVRSLARIGNYLYVGGKFNQIAGQSRTYLARLNVSNPAPVLDTWAPNPNDYVYSLAHTTTDLYVGGAFDLIQGINQPAFAKFSLATGVLQQSLTPGTGQVNALALSGTRLYGGGTFLGSTGYFTGGGALLTGAQETPSFSFPRFGGAVHSLISDGAGGWYAGGAFTFVNGQTSGRLVHILSNGSLDPAFNPLPSGTIYALHLRGDTLYAGGTFSTIMGQSRANLAAIKTSANTLLAWQPDPNGKVSVISSFNNQLYIGGTFVRVGGKLHPRFAVLNRTTAAALRVPVPDAGEVLTIQQTSTSGGHLYAGGNFNGDVGYPAVKATLLTAAADIPPSKFPDFNLEVQAAVPDGSGGWYVAGAFTLVNGNTIQRLAHIASDTTLDLAFSFSINNAVSTLARSGNTLYIGGLFTTIDGQTRNRLAAIDLTTKTLLTWNPDADGQVNSLQVSGTTVYAGGSFFTLGGQPRNRIGALNATTGAVLAWNPDANNTVNVLLVSGSTVYAGGLFTTIGGQTRNRLAALDAATGTASTWNPDVNSAVTTLALNGATSLYLGGSFTQVGGQTRNRLAEVNLSTGAVQPFNPNMNNTVETLLLTGGSLYVGGIFTQVGGQSYVRLVALNPATGLPSTWLPSPNGTVSCLAVNGSQLFVGGNFDVLKSISRSRIYDLNPATLAVQSFAPVLNNAVNTLTVYQGDLFVGGTFTIADGQNRNRLARWNISNGSLAAWNPNADDAINTLLIRSDTVFAGGEFLNIGGASRSRLAALGIAGGLALTWQPEPDNAVYTLAGAGTTLVAGGLFEKLDANTRNRLFCLDVTTGTLTDWAPDLPGIFFGPRVNALAVSGDSVWVGGQFGALSGEPRQNLALTDGLTGQVLAPLADTEGEVMALLTEGDHLWVGGHYLDSVNHQHRENAALLNRHTGAVLSFDPGADDYVHTFASLGNLVAIGGNIDHLVSRKRNGGFAVKVSEDKLLPWNPDLGINSQITSIALDPRQQQAYVGGYFSTLHGVSRQNLARVSLDTGEPDAWQADVNLPVYMLAWSPELKQVFVGGNFSSIGGQPRSYLGAVDINGQVLPFNPSPDQEPHAIAWHDTAFFVSGSFTTIGGQPRQRLAALNANGQVLDWAPVVQTASGAPGTIYEITVGAERLYIGGFFAQVNSETRYRIAAFDLKTLELLPFAPPVSPNSGTNANRVLVIHEANNQLFLAGTMQEIGGTFVNGFAWMDPISGLVKGMLISANGFIEDVISVDSLLFVGGNFTRIDQEDAFSHASYSFPDGYFSPGLTGISPQSGGNTGDVTVSIYGGGFRDGLRVILRAPGLPDIVGIDSLTAVFGGVQAKTTFNLRNQVAGMRDVLIISAADTQFIAGGFEVLEGGRAGVWAEILVPPAMRVPRSADKPTYYNLVVNFGNSGSVDAEGVPIWVAIDTSIIVHQLGFKWVPQQPGMGSPADTALQFVQVDTVFGTAFGANIYVMIVPRIPAGTQAYLTMQVIAKKVGPVYFSAWATDPWYGSPLKYAVGECYDLLIGKVAGLVPIAGCIYGGLDALLSPMFDAGYDPENFASPQWFANYSLTLANAIVECGLVASGGGMVLDIMKDILSYANLVSDINTVLQNCIPQFPQPKPPGPGGANVLGAIDPNQKGGPQGAGSQRWVSEVRPMPYLVEFENVDTATAPAQLVEIRDTLDASVYDLNSLELNYFSIADSVYAIPRGRQAWNAWVDLRPRVNSLVEVEAALEGNVLRWTFESLDPATLVPQTGVLDGFLPPNTNDPEGRGSVSYTIRRPDNLPTFTTVSNRAAIYFDANAPILTNTWTNTIDVDAPQSQMAPLDTLQLSRSIPLHWQGSDIGSGIWYYTLMVSENGGPFQRRADYILDTAFIFPGQWGYRYQFYTLAVDTAGNIESAPLVADAFTHVLGGLSVSEPERPVIALYPNPNNGSFTLDIYSPIAQTAQVNILDLAGRRLVTEQVQLQVGQTVLQRRPGLAAGSYFVAVETAQGREVMRLTIY
ncbi:MAG: PQQ-binding-like beta-propeller repeat protein [Bacteroidia bacterium]|nr:PQQ-binding-like beta-propeller repeat protein [Bacteroidia bacterium]